jgi:hypothetical protein
MKLLVNMMLSFFILVFTLDSQADTDNLKLTRYDDARRVPAHFMTLLGSEAILKSYKDNEGITRTDKK